jgi:hypothetical protein
MRSSRQRSVRLTNRFPHDRGRLRDKYAGGGRDGDEGKVVDVGMSGDCGGDCPRAANSTSSGSLWIESLEMTERTHSKRAIQAMINKIEKMMTKIVEASGVKTREASVVYILLFES